MSASVICVDIGGTTSKAGIVDPSGQLHLVNSIPTQPSVETYFDALCDLIHRTWTAGQAHGHDPVGMGVAVAGFLNLERDRLVYNPNLNWLEDFALREHLARRFQIRIELETDSNSACMAEFHLGSGQNARRFLCLTAGTGLGVGMTVNGEPLRFAYGCLGDIGHIIVQPGGELCSCGGRGCAEALISAPALAERYARSSGKASPLSLRDVIEAAHNGDAIAVSILQEAGERLGIAVASMANILFPDHIAIAGGLSAAGSYVLDAAERVFRESASILARSNVPFTRATLGPSATLIGAAWPFWKISRRGE
jgi:glucokinase-like ROK family protein